MECLERLFPGKKEEKKKIFSRQPGVFVLGRTLALLEPPLIRAGHRPRLQSDKYEKEKSGTFCSEEESCTKRFV